MRFRAADSEATVLHCSVNIVKFVGRNPDETADEIDKSIPEMLSQAYMCKRFDTEMARGYKLRAICSISRESITFYGVGWYPSNKNLTELYAPR